ncbi:MAG TPA: TonB family protein [Burkholderiales bacterium]
MPEIALDQGGYFPSPLTEWYRERPFKVALVGSLLVHALLLAMVPGFRSGAVDVPKVLNIEILKEEQPQQVVAAPTRRQPEPKPEIVPSPQPVVEQPVVRPEPKIERRPEVPEVKVRPPEPVLRAPEPVVRPPAPDVPPVPQSEVIQATPKAEQKPEFTMPKPGPRPVPEVDSRPIPRAEVLPESPTPRAAPPPAPVVEPQIVPVTPPQRDVPPPAVPQAAVQPPPVAVPAAPVAPPAVAADPVAEKTLSTSYEKSLSDLIKRNERYPDRARRQRWQGTVIIALSLSAEGKVKDISIAESSGRDILDDAALEMVRRASPLPRAPEGLRGKERSVRVPIAFKLPDS